MLAVLALSFLCAAAPGDDLAGAARQSAAAVLPTYQWFHRHPELSGQEAQTAAHLAQALRALGLEVHEGIGGHGIVALLHGARPGPVVMYRADMDALPLRENTGLPYASETPGVMHACGHDIHMATALGTLKLLKERVATWNGTVVFIGQPAEETVQGARAMLADARFGKILAPLGKPTLSLGLHDASDLPVGTVALLAGAITANVDSVDVILHGKGGHGSQPQQTVDPIVMGAEFILQAQTIVSRRLAPGEKAVVTVGQFQAGTKRNIIPASATLLLTLRSFEPTVRQQLVTELRTIAQHIAASYHAPREPEVIVAPEGTESVVNDGPWVDTLRRVFAANLGPDNVVVGQAQTYGEDVGYFARALGCPGVFFGLGAVNAKVIERTPAHDLPSLHSDRFAPDAEPTLATGIRAMTLALLAALMPVEIH